MKKYHLALLIVAGLAAGCANADSFSITLDSAILTGSPGDVLSFSGTIVNTTASSIDLSLAADNINITDFTSGIDDSPFFANLPFSLDGGASTGDIGLFNITIPNPFTLPPGDNPYSGTFQILDDCGAVAGTAFFDVNVNIPSGSVPEPASVALLAGALGCWFAGKHMAKQAMARRERGVS